MIDWHIWTDGVIWRLYREVGGKLWLVLETGVLS